MKRFPFILVPAAGAMALAACGSPSSGSGSGPASDFVLVGALSAADPAASANFLINGNSCSYYVYRGNGSNPPQLTKSCTLKEDQSNAMGAPHGTVKIGFSTDSGNQVLTLTEAANAGLSAKTVPDIGMFVPKSWTMAKPAANMTLDSTAAGSAYSGVAIRVGGASCSITVTPESKTATPTSKTAAPASTTAAPAAGKTADSMPCGLVFWSSNQLTVAIPGSLISSAAAKQAWKLQFYKNGATWSLSLPPPGFPPTFSEAAPEK